MARKKEIQNPVKEEKPVEVPKEGKKYRDPIYRVLYTCQVCGNKHTLDCFGHVFCPNMLCVKDLTQMRWRVIKE